MANSVLGLRIMPELQCWKKISASTRKIFIFLKNKKKRKKEMHSYSQKCQSDQQRLEVLMYLSLTYRLFFSLYLFIYLNVHTFCAEHCCSIFLIFKVTLFAIVSLEKWHTLLWAPKIRNLWRSVCLIFICAN